ncbi:hypothetical protein [Pseudomonas aeruginosa]|uniref:hypothetical protein n=1 Tax=Pseudomonas aeruginosa TaxID=287 RepID=UPI002118D9CD|nr:hypothetical protein [Pseudomonas aeruginosa]MCT5277773.1 hypothetical protein [Pseudomonas aeruginosa]
MSSTQHQLIEQCAIRLRGIVEALDNIHDSTQHRSPHRWSTDLDDVHSSAESLLALIKDQAPARSEASFEEWLANELEGEDGQPVPAAVCDIALARRAFNHWPKLEQPAKVGGVRFSAGVSSRLVVEAAQRLNEFESTPEQEAERPEMSPERAAYFMRRFKSEEKLLGPNEQAAVDYVLSLLAQHESIVGALRAENAKLSEALDRWPLIRDSLKLRLADALARVAALESKLAELEKQEPVAWGAFHFGGKRDGKLYTHCETEAQIEAYILDMHRSSDSLTLSKGPLYAAPVDQAQHSVPDGAADLCRFLAKLYCELDGLRYSTAKLPAEQIADALIFKWPVLQGARNQLNIKRISEQPYDESKLHSAIAAMLAAAPGKEVPQAWIDVQEERRRQITAEGWTPEHDDEHADGQMAQAAGCYALHAGGIGTDWPDGRQNGSALFWPWDKDSWKPTTPRRDLVKACALALAEIERLDRAGISQSPQPGATTASS